MPESIMPRDLATIPAVILGGLCGYFFEFSQHSKLIRIPSAEVIGGVCSGFHLNLEARKFLRDLADAIIDPIEQQ